MLQRLICGLAAMFLFAAPAAAQPIQATLTVRTDEPGPVISRFIQGQFWEHLGRGVYEGVWVGPNSRIPNTRGFRNDVLEALRDLDVPVVRWPGGCFADWYHWRDGIGPRNRRPVRLNATWGGVEEPNAVGTHEFFDFVELIGAEAYLNFNIGTAGPQEMVDWLEYITSDTNSALANERRRNGREEPWKLAFVTIGNETWGCGGNMCPEFYADLYAQYATFYHPPASNRGVRVAAGPHGDNPQWTEALMTHPTAAPLFDAISIHHYTLPTSNWSVKGPTLGFGEDQWISTMRRTLQMDAILDTNTEILNRSDPGGRVALYVDEWGTWYDTEEGASALYQQNTLRDGLVAALNFNVFHDHAERVRMANIAQMVNVLQAMILTDGPRMLRTPTYHAFHMYRPFQDSTRLGLTLDAPPYALGDVSVPSISASAARGQDGAIHIALVNLDPNRPAQISARVEGAHGGSVAGRILTAESMDAHNTFDAPDTLVPTAFTGAALSGDALSVALPAKSVVVLTIQ